MSASGIEVSDLMAEAGLIYGFIMRRTGGDRPVAEDLTQETLLVALQNAYQPARGSLRQMVLGIALRKIADHERRRRISGRHQAPVSRELLSRMKREPLPQEELEREEVRRAVNETLVRLPEEMAVLLVRKYSDGVTTGELAAELGASEKAIEGRLTRARAAFLAAMEALCREDLEVGPP
jgi:RNA polymerase sigma-70 factor (ECF subfamily)